MAGRSSPRSRRREAPSAPGQHADWLLDPTQQFNDPRRDWTGSSADHTDTITGSMDLIRLTPRIDIKLAFDYRRSESTYTYGLAP